MLLRFDRQEVAASGFNQFSVPAKGTLPSYRTLRTVFIMGRFSFYVATAFVAIVISILCSPSVTAQQASSVNRGIVEIETAGTAGISVRMAEDLANLIDDGATRRVLPVIGKGSLQILTDLRYLRGIDMAILPTDVLDYAKEQRLYPGIDSFLTYITKLHNEEFHLLARREVKDISELANQKVNVDLLGSGTSITTSRLFALLKLP